VEGYLVLVLVVVTVVSRKLVSGAKVVANRMATAGIARAQWCQWVVKLESAQGLRLVRVWLSVVSQWPLVVEVVGWELWVVLTMWLGTQRHALVPVLMMMLVWMTPVLRARWATMRVILLCK
jgi:hypothetical protein